MNLGTKALQVLRTVAPTLALAARAAVNMVASRNDSIVSDPFT